MSTIANPLSVKALNKRFGHFDAVQDVSFEINAGEIVALLGPSGCGKTTCLRMIAGLVEPTSGSIALRGKEITGLPVSGRNIGMLFQSYALFPHMTVAENVAFGLQTRRMSKDAYGRNTNVNECAMPSSTAATSKRPSAGSIRRPTGRFSKS
ncbi:ABC transporter ATP-binding protein [Agrobacterium rosae]|uniref:ABC transporter ATP-binding protein n=1 Tax=Agrobacterium rosae TaxID=1972867 RepID=A0AAW9FT29_9HYPH|nr:ABC transporter ATP-binding protein [Agrobacterium rosae]MDX8306010.1 ABC transporter ATP-binding protein [Agrobacterium rosae]